MVLPVVVALEMIGCGGREERRKLPLWRERERDSCRCGERAWCRRRLVPVVVERRESCHISCCSRRRLMRQELDQLSVSELHA